MFLTTVVISVLLLSMLTLFLAFNLYRRRQALNSKRAEYLAVTRVNASHWKRFETTQVEISHLNADAKARADDLNGMMVLLNKKKDDIREVLDILKEEKDGIDSHMGNELNKIVERRIQILRGHWKETNGMKMLFIQKMQEAVQLKAGIESLLSRKDAEYMKWTETKIQLERLKREFAQLTRSPILSFSRKL